MTTATNYPQYPVQVRLRVEMLEENIKNDRESETSVIHRNVTRFIEIFKAKKKHARQRVGYV